ncbi:uncharacterized protein L201_002933 [Kwoniella dendrophila CBS 6074]|uniref:Elongator complex protein 4 n=1 Tax=Kwoniella dendrophila CBS 6074 TaxID=1295534 RepID=A0AAX4JRK0_9TREE
MPSFTRRVPSTTLPPPAGTHPSPSLSSLNLLPSGLPSLDDLLGGGIPLGNIWIVLTPDTQSNWSKLIERYWISQGLISGQSNLLIGSDKESNDDLIKGCMWTEKNWKGDAEESQSENEAEDDSINNNEAKKIAWRYEKMAKFKTTVGGNGSNLSLMNQIPPEVLTSIYKTGQQLYINLSDSQLASESSTSPLSIFDSTIQGIYERVQKADPKRAGRITVNELGGLDWGDDVSVEQIHRFIHSLKSIIRTKSISALITIPPHLITGPNKETFIRKLSWSVDACVELKGFADDPTLPPLFPTTHGLITLHSYPTSHTLLPSTLKHSTLLGVSQSSDGGGGAGENNLGFRLKRKKFVIETVHLGVEGGVGERSTGPPDITSALSGTQTSISTSTTPISSANEGIEKVNSPTVSNAKNDVDNSITQTQQIDDQGVEKPKGPDLQATDKPKKPRARVRFGGEEEMVINVSTDEGKQSNQTHQHDHDHDHSHHEHGHDHSHDNGRSQNKAPRVQLRHDRPDLYEF